MKTGNGLIFGTGVSSKRDYAGLLETVQVAVASGIRAFDTAPSYRTEKTLGKVLRQVMKEQNLTREEIVVQTKIDGWQMQKSSGDIQRYVADALEQMHLDYFDSLLIHWPLPEHMEQTWRSFVKLYEAGTVKQIGICNLRLRQLKKCLSYDFLPQVIQIERHPLRVCGDEIEFCRTHGISVQAYSPLCKMDERIRDSAVLGALSEKYGKNIGQIVLRWHLDTGVMPVFTSTKQHRIREYAGIFDFALTEEDIDAVSSLNVDYKMYLESCACPGF